MSVTIFISYSLSAVGVLWGIAARKPNMQDTAGEAGTNS